MKFFGLEFKFNGFDIWHKGNFDVNSKAGIVHNHKSSEVTVGRVPYFINGTGTVDGTWLGSEGDITSYYDGLAILYKVPVDGTTTTTLNINGLGAKTIYRYSNSKLTTHYPIDSILLLIYSETLNGGCFMTEGSDYDSTESYTIRWNNSLQAGVDIFDYKLVMMGTDGKVYPLTLEAGTGTTKTVSTVEFAIDSPILFYGRTTDLLINTTSTSYWYSGVYTSYLNYTANQVSGFTAYRPIYIKGTITPNGTFKLDNSSYTSWLTQTLPVADDGFVYIHIGYMGNTTTSIRLTDMNTILQYKDGLIRRYIPTHKHVKAEITDIPTKLSEFTNDIGAGGGVKITTNTVAPSTPSPSDFWFKEI